MNPDGLPVLPGYMFDQSWQGLVSLALAVLLPVIVGLLTKASWSPGLKALLLLGLAALKSFGEAWLVAGPDFNVEQVAWAIGLNFAIAVTMQYGLYKHTITPRVQDMLVRDTTPSP